MEMKITLSNKFYTRESIIEAIKDFGDIFEAKILNEKYEIAIKSSKILDNVVDEFCNYVLALMKNDNLV